MFISINVQDITLVPMRLLTQKLSLNDEIKCLGLGWGPQKEIKKGFSDSISLRTSALVHSVLHEVNQIFVNK